MTTIPKYTSLPLTPNNHRKQPWRLISKGLNIEGLCTNKTCQAYNQMVILNLGFNEFDLSRIILQRNNKCPLCKTKVHPIKYALNQCRWWYVDHYSTHTYPLNTVYDTYELKDLICEYIIMETMPLPSTYQASSISQEIICPICLINNENDTTLVHLKCSHTFHQKCINEWLQSNQSMARTCPVCRVRINGNTFV